MSGSELKKNDFSEKFKNSPADEIAWTPLHGGGKNFCDLKLVKTNPLEMTFKITPLGYIFSGIFILVGLGVFSIPLIEYLTGKVHLKSTKDFIFLFAFGAVFFGVGCVLAYNLSRKIIFSKRSGKFSKDKEIVPLAQITGVQLLAEYIEGNESSYYSYEINLVLKEKKRINLVDHGKLETAHEDAKALSLFLNVPLHSKIGESQLAMMVAKDKKKLLFHKIIFILGLVGLVLIAKRWLIDPFF